MKGLGNEEVGVFHLIWIPILNTRQFATRAPSRAGRASMTWPGRSRVWSGLSVPLLLVIEALDELILSLTPFLSGLINADFIVGNGTLGWAITLTADCFS